MGVGGQELCTFSEYEHIWHIYPVTVDRRVATRALCGLMPGVWIAKNIEPAGGVFARNIEPGDRQRH